MADMTCAIAFVNLIVGVFGQQPSALPKLPVSLLKVTEISGKIAAIPRARSKATVLFVVAVDCPIANRMAPEIARIIKDYREKGVDAWMVYPDKTLKSSAVADHLKAYGISAHATIDIKHALVKATGASVTPHAVVLDKTGHVRYLGRINDLYADHGRTSPTPQKHDLRDALDDLLAGRPVKTPVTEAIGCHVPEQWEGHIHTTYVKAETARGCD